MEDKISDLKSKTAGKSIPNSISAVLCSLIALIMLFSILNDYRKSIPLPIPYDFAEGVTCWMARELSVLKSPYGDIEAIPSRYSAYGPLFPSAVAALSHIIPINKTPPLATPNPTIIKLVGDIESQFFIIGRSLNALFWLLTGFIVGLLSRKWQYALLMCPVPCIVFSTLFPMWTWRIDSLVMLLEASILVVLTHQKTTNNTLLWRPIEPKRLASVVGLVSCLVLTKPTAIIDLLPILILSYCLHSQSKTYPDNWKTFFIPSIISLAIAVGFGALLLLGTNYLSSGWMFNNIFKIQPLSGWHNNLDFQTEFGHFFKNPSIIILGIWTLLIPMLTSSKKIAGIYLGLSISLFFCAATSLKFGAAVNYYMPLLVVALAICTLGFKKYTGVLFLLILVSIVNLPLKPANLPFRAERWKLSNTEASTLAAIVNQHKSDKVITEDAFFSVLANHQPLVSDIFQFLVINQLNNKNRDELKKSVKRVWAGWRVGHVIGQTPANYSTKPPIINTLRNVTGTSAIGQPIIKISESTIPVNNREIGLVSFFYSVTIPCILIALLGPIAMYYRKC